MFVASLCQFLARDAYSCGRGSSLLCSDSDVYHTNTLGLFLPRRAKVPVKCCAVSYMRHFGCGWGSLYVFVCGKKLYYQVGVDLFISNGDTQ